MRVPNYVLIAIGSALLFAFLWYLSYEPPPFFNSTEESNSEARVAPEGYKEYRTPLLRFSLLYPDYLSVREARETATSYSIVFEDLETHAGFQIYVQNYGEPSITDEVFLRDVPSGVRENEERVYVGGVSARSFDSINQDIGDTHEVWFLNNGYLYEITTYRALGEWLHKDILHSWRFL